MRKTKHLLFTTESGGEGSSPDLTSQSTLHACLQRVNAM